MFFFESVRNEDVGDTLWWCALVAQGIEHRSPKAGVGRSNRLGGTANLDTSGEMDRDSE